MTSVYEVLNDKNYITILDKGFVGVVETMGTDNSIVQAARVSYGKGTKKINEDRGLIRYLMRHKHTSPFEMCQIKLHIKIPIFVMRQLVRHRTASLNEMSARYSILPNEFYMPQAEDLAPQSTTNKQGRAGTISDEDKKKILFALEMNNEHSYSTYEELLQDPEYIKAKAEALANDPEFDFKYDILALGLSDEYPGLARELSRMVLPVNVYTELYWSQNLHNMFHLLKLRTDPHAQLEIRVLADAIYQHVKRLFPVATEAWEDYSRDAKTLSRMQLNLLRDLFIGLKNSNGTEEFELALNLLKAGPLTNDDILKEYGLNKSEFEDLKAILIRENKDV